MTNGPNLTRGSEPFWNGLEESEIRIQRCTECDDYRFPPSDFCPSCGETDHVWDKITPTGTLHSFTRQHRTPPGFSHPLILGTLDLDVGVRLLVPIDEDYDSLRIGQRLRLIPSEYDQDYERGALAGRPFFTAIRAATTEDEG